MHRIPRFTSLLVLLALVLALTPVQAQDAPATSDDPANMARGKFNEGNTMMRAENYEGALAMFDEGLALDSTNAKNAYGRALALAQLDREDEATAAFEHAVMVAEAAADDQIMTDARRWIGTSAYRRASGLLQANPLPRSNAEEALPLLQRAEAGGLESPQLPYQFARVYNAIGQHEDAARYAELAVEANAGASDLSPYYIELGIARKEMGDIAAARAAFEEAKNGSWSSWADHYLGELDALDEGSDAEIEEMGSGEMDDSGMEEMEDSDG